MKKIFSKGIVYPFFTLLGIVAIFDWIVFPLLTAADTLGNILGLVIGFFTVVFAFYSLGINTIISKYLNSDGLVDSTELKEVEQMKVKPKAKRKSKTTN